MAGGHEEEAGFWPGYVAAVSGLVQGLLIMAMALGISIYALGRLATAAGKKTGAPPPSSTPVLGQPPGPATPPFDAGQPPPLTPPPPPQPAAATAPAGTSVQPLRPAPAPDTILATLTFFGDAVDLPPSSIADMKDIVGSYRASGAERFRISLAVDAENPRERRAGYLRLMAIRGVLLDAGIPGDRVQLQLTRRAAAAADDDSAVAELHPLDAAGAPLVRRR